MSLSLLFLRGPPCSRRELLTQRHKVTSQKTRIFSRISIVTTCELILQFSPAVTSDRKCILYLLREVFQIEVKYVFIASLCCNCQLETCHYMVKILTSFTLSKTRHWLVNPSFLLHHPFLSHCTLSMHHDVRVSGV